MGKTKTTKQGSTAKRKPLSKKIRFEVFKRDKFTCQYCGGKSPEVVLHVDHIKPVKSGGDNAITNLTTSCSECNLGKGARELSDDSIVSKQRTEMELQQEKLNQIKLMADWQRSLLSVDKESVDLCSEILCSLTDKSLSDAGRKKFSRWISKYGLQIVIDALKTSIDQYYLETDDSIEKSIDMIPKIAAVKIEPEWKQEALKYMNYSKRNGWSYNDARLFKELINNRGDDVKKLCLSELYQSGMCLGSLVDVIIDEIGEQHD